MCAMGTGSLPVPNLTIVRRASGHLHVAWMLRRPCSSASRTVIGSCRSLCTGCATASSSTTASPMTIGGCWRRLPSRSGSSMTSAASGAAERPKQPTIRAPAPRHPRAGNRACRSAAHHPRPTAGVDRAGRERANLVRTAVESASAARCPSSRPSPAPIRSAGASSRPTAPSGDGRSAAQQACVSPAGGGRRTSGEPGASDATSPRWPQADTPAGAAAS